MPVMDRPQIGWSSERTATGPRIRPLVWEPCWGCWGQGRVYAGDLVTYWMCDRCLGVGQMAVPA